MIFAIFNLTGNIPRAKQDSKRRARGRARISAAKFRKKVGMLSKPQDLDEDSERMISKLSKSKLEYKSNSRMKTRKNTTQFIAKKKQAFSSNQRRC